MPSPKTAYLCTGKDCRKRTSDAAKLESLFEGAGFECQHVRCQKICSGPVVGLTLNDSIEWFEKVRGKSGRTALERFLKNEGGPLWKLHKPKKSGKLRQKKRSS